LIATHKLDAQLFFSLSTPEKLLFSTILNDDGTVAHPSCHQTQCPEAQYLILCHSQSMRVFLKTQTKELLTEYLIPSSYATFEWASLIHVQGKTFRL
jgi:hypothetical protein